MFNKYLIYGAIALGISSAAYFAVSSYKEMAVELQNTKNSVASLEVTIKSYELAIEETNARIRVVEEQRLTHEASVLGLTNEIEKAKRDLTSLKHREKTVVAKPKLVELKINKAFVKQQKTYACITGDKTACEQP